MAILAFDVDGVLASFEHGLAPILTKLTGIEFPVGTVGFPSVWDWDLAAGVTRLQQAEAWETIKTSKTFWLDLPAHSGASEFLRWISLLPQHDIYFITNRMGQNPKFQTERWLKHWGFQGHPTVLISGKKGYVCNALGVDLYVDDKTENCFDVNNLSPKTTCFMLQRPYNRSIGGRRGTLADFTEAIKELK